MDVFINKKYFEKNKKKAEDRGKEEGFEDSITFDDLHSREVELTITADNLNATFETDLGYFNIDLPLSQDNFISFLEIAVKKANKLKTLIEAAK